MITTESTAGANKSPTVIQTRNISAAAQRGTNIINTDNTEPTDDDGGKQSHNFDPKSEQQPDEFKFRTGEGVD